MDEPQDNDDSAGPDYGSEDSRLSGRVRRYAKVGTSVGGLAAQVVASRVFGSKLDKTSHSADLKQALGGLKGPLMKAAQILATIPDALPKEYAEELRQLQSNAPAMGWAFVRRRMRSELGADWQSRFAAFEREPAAAASLGQVHRAESHEGASLACKLQYPDMLSAVEADLQQLKIIFGIYRRYDRAIDPSEVHKELSARLREELDYEREARHMRLYGRILGGEEGIAVPETLADLSTARLLSMTWLEGRPLLAWLAEEPPQELRDLVAMRMFRAWYVPFYNYGIIHGDPHLGNYTMTPEGGVNLLDFGCIRIFPPAFVKGVIELYFALSQDDPARAEAAYRSWGFDDISKELLATLNLWAYFLYEPLLEDRPTKVLEDGGSMRGARLAGEVHEELRRLGGVTPPREFVLMDRAAIGLGSVFMHLKAQVNWHRLFHDLIDEFDEAALAKRQAASLKAVGLETPD